MIFAQSDPAVGTFLNGRSWAGVADCICQIPHFYDFAPFRHWAWWLRCTNTLLSVRVVGKFQWKWTIILFSRHQTVDQFAKRFSNVARVTTTERAKTFHERPYVRPMFRADTWRSKDSDANCRWSETRSILSVTVLCKASRRLTGSFWGWAWVSNLRSLHQLANRFRCCLYSREIRARDVRWIWGTALNIISRRKDENRRRTMIRSKTCRLSRAVVFSKDDKTCNKARKGSSERIISLIRRDVCPASSSVFTSSVTSTRSG